MLNLMEVTLKMVALKSPGAHTMEKGLRLIHAMTWVIGWATQTQEM